MDYLFFLPSTVFFQNAILCSFAFVSFVPFFLILTAPPPRTRLVVFTSCSSTFPIPTLFRIHHFLHSLSHSIFRLCCLSVCQYNLYGLKKIDVFKLFIQRLYYNTKDMREMYSTSSVNRICSVTGTGPPFKSTKTITHHEKEKLGLGIVRLKGETISHNRGEE